ncbi:hypothetical protein OEZ86_014276 [Tetradesmus obliquus]|nr:hypothetical protein OEZ86_014276 [Tetradesmus obliquus]
MTSSTAPAAAAAGPSTSPAPSSSPTPSTSPPPSSPQSQTSQSPSAAVATSPASNPSPSPAAQPPAPPKGQQGAAAAGSGGNPCLYPGDDSTQFLTVDSRCREDQFNIAILEFTANWTWQGEESGPEQFSNVYITNGWATIRGLTDNQFIRPRPKSSSSSRSSSSSSSQMTGQYVAVVRVADGKFVVPKSVDLSGSTAGSSSSREAVNGSSSSSSSSSLVDVSSSKLAGCVLVGDTEDRPFPRFRIVVQAGSNRMLADSVAAPGVPIFKGRQGVACEDVKERVLGFAGSTDPTRGRLVDFYEPSSCKFVIDDCSG